MEEKIQINDLPLEIFIEILIKIDGISVGKCRRVCKRWRDSIDGSDQIWHEMCRKEFKYSSQIAKRKAGNDCRWYHVYKNLKLWLNITKYDKKVREFYKFSLHDKSHVLEIDYGVLPLKDARGVVFYDISTLKYIPVAISDVTCSKIANNDNITVILTKSGLYVQKCVDSNNTTEEFFKADNFVLAGDELYYYKSRDVYKCDLTSPNLSSNLLLHCNYSIKEIQYCGRILHLFTTCGRIINITKDNISEKLINCPIEWVKHLRNIYAINDRNFVCYSRHIFKLDTDLYHHLYLEFPPITALFFYADIVLIATRAGELLLYRLSSQKKGRMSRPIFETLTIFPEGKFAVQLDVCERKNGPLIVASTFFEIILVEYNFFPHEEEPKCSFPVNKISMYKRLLRLKDRLQST
ncbi:PREDICTED: uncharacterized protein LOC106125680 [Papilio xuthus]|uniref:Uncharacterized protein LOC106125680 n=1 Tax=Papilio xuthus TaxID=66420 RepID=A0AAJ7EIA4_PAPXU|nr:PREDICTED: uncharacterized protein LOC106125680 [Papilio xuthus]